MPRRPNGDARATESSSVSSLVRQVPRPPEENESAQGSRRSSVPAGPSTERRRSTHKDWCFTLNNPTEEEVQVYKGMLSSSAVRYGLFQREVGALGTPHLQGYFELSRPRALSTVRTMFPRIHAEPRRGSRDQARDYCLKSDTAIPGTREEFGDWAAGGSGSRNDIRAVTSMIDAGSSVREVILAHPTIVARYPRFPQMYFNARVDKRHWKTQVFVFLGPTGVGKSKMARRLFPRLYSKPPGATAHSVWFDNYEAHRHVLIDDFRGTDMPFEFLLQLLDRYDLQVPTKGGFAEFVPYTIVITSNKHPNLWYNRDDPDANAPLLRRIDRIYDEWPLNATELASLTRLASYGSPGGLPLLSNE